MGEPEAYEEPDAPVELGRVANTAAFAVAVAGIFAFGAGFQVAAFIRFRPGVAAWFPWVELATGGALVWLAIQLAHPRRWAPRAALGTLAALLVASTLWAAWLLYGGFFSPLVLFVPMVSVPAALLVVLGWRDFARVATVRAAAEAEFAAFTQAQAPTGNRWFLPVAYGAVGTVLVPLAFAIFAPDRFLWATTRVRGLLAGRNPFGDVLAKNATDYPYSGSPLVWYLDTEARYTKVPKDDVLAVADRIANNVGMTLAAETGIADPVAAEVALWKAGRGKELPLWVAAELRGIHAFYSQESLFSRSFDPDAHVLPDQVHMDCDQLVWVFLHVASRLDLAMSAMPSPLHVYLRYAGPSGEAPLFVETTQFRNVIVDAEHVDMMGPAIGESFFVDEDFYPSGKGGIWARHDLVVAAGLFAPWGERDIKDSILGNVLVGVEQEGQAVDVIAEAEKQVDGSRDVTLVANLYAHRVARAQQALAENRPEDARVDALRARALRATFGPLVVTGEATEENILAALDPPG